MMPHEHSLSDYVDLKIENSVSQHILIVEGDNENTFWLKNYFQGKG